MEFELKKRREYHNKNRVWYQIGHSQFFLDEDKETLFLFRTPNNESDENVELEGEEEENSEVYEVEELVSVDIMKDMLRELEKQGV